MHVQALRSHDGFLKPLEKISFWTQTLRTGSTNLFIVHSVYERLQLCDAEERHGWA